MNRLHLHSKRARLSPSLGEKFAEASHPFVTGSFPKDACCNCLYEGCAGLSKLRVLLADDNTQVLDYVRELLAANGCEVIGTATDGQSAVDAAAQLMPDILVLDISMPILNGIRAARRVLEDNRSIKILFLTAHRDPETCRAALETGASCYVLKPRLASDLIPAIKFATEGRQFMSPGCE